MQNGIFGAPSKGKNGNINFSLGNILEMKVRNNKDTVETLKKNKTIREFKYFKFV